MKTNFTLLLFFCFCNCFSKNQDVKVDSLFYSVAPQLKKEGKFKEAVVLYKKIIQLYLNKGQEREAIKAEILLASVYFNLYNIKESSIHLERSLARSTKINDCELITRSLSEYARINDGLGYLEIALDYYNKALNQAKCIKDEKIKNYLIQYTYCNICVVNEKKGNFKLLYTNLKNAEKALSDTYVNSEIARYFLVFEKDKDSAKYYLQRAEYLNRSGRFDIFQKSVLLKTKGLYAYEDNKLNDAIYYYHKSLQISQELSKPQDEVIVYQLLYNTYKKLGDNNNAIINLEKYSKINDSLQIKKLEIQDIPLKKIVKEKEIRNSLFKRKIILFFFIITIILAFIVFFVREKMKKKEKVNLLQLEIKDKETAVLKKKINESFEEIIELAKQNQPEFLARFKEVYPEFISKMENKNSKLKNSELTLIAYVYLGFTSKDISRYTYKSINTVKVRKYNLRKKLSIPTEINMETWFKNL